MNRFPASTGDMLALLDQWTTCGWLRPLDLALTRFLVAEVPETDPALMLAIVLVSHQLGRGHVCLDLEATLHDPYMALSLPPEQAAFPGEEALLRPDELLAGWRYPEDWIARIESPELVGSGEGKTPLVRVGTRLYLRRYWRYEREVESAILRRVNRRFPTRHLKTTLDALFPPPPSGKTDWQKIACARAAESAFSIITGGPGTGKTTTVVRLLALLQHIALAGDAATPLQIRLCAPTGKAAARLRESIAGAIERLPAFVRENETLRQVIPDEVSTLHRLLGTLPDSRRFRYNARQPLPLDLLVVDEASMIDLEMMAAVLSALPEHARLILLGDKDQLASVEAGSVLGELCQRAGAGHFRPETVQRIESLTGERVDASLVDAQGTALDQQIVMLRESHRFTATSGIGRLASAVNAGDVREIGAVWNGHHADIFRYDLDTLDDARLETILLAPDSNGDAPQGYAAYLKRVAERPALDASEADFAAWAKRVLVAHGSFQLLCVLRNGPYGVEGMNQRIEAMLAKRRLIATENVWYEGRPVLVTRNDYRLGLMNGDIGITLACPKRDPEGGERQWGVRVAFPNPDSDGGIQWVLPSRLSAVETVFALTVHKSQGSEFAHCALLLPPHRNPVLTRELIYTGITRGRQWFSMICPGNRAILNDAACRTVQRSGGLFAVPFSSLNSADQV